MVILSRLKRGNTLREALACLKLFQKNPSRKLKYLEVITGKKFFCDSSSKNIVSSPLGNVEIPKLLFHDFIVENWSLWERKTALECGKTKKKYSFKKINSRFRALAAAFQNKLKLSKGDIIALVLPNCPDYPVIILASSKAGLISTTVNPLYTVDELLNHFTDCGVKCVITDTDAYEKCVKVMQIMKVSFPVIVVKHTPRSIIPEGAIDYVELCDPSSSGEFTPVSIEFDDILLLPYSSGTTGGPKGVMLTHRNIVSNLVQLDHPESNIIMPNTWWRQDKSLGVLPMFHIFGMIVCTFFPLRQGCHLILLPRFAPELYIRNIYLKKVNILYVVPPLIRFLGFKEVKQKYLKYVHFIVNGAAALDVADTYKVLEKAEHLTIVQGYGMTETSPVLTHTSSTRMQKLKSIGIPVSSTKLKVVCTETGRTLSTGQTGELCAWGPQIMKGYLNRPEETKNAFDSEGWLRTGDIAFFDEDRDFFIVQRLKELIKVKGFQVSPAELEDIIIRHPKIQDVVVVGVPDPHYEEVPRAFVILEKDAQMTEEEVTALIKNTLSEYKQLRGGVRFLKEFPKNSIGKILRKELKKYP